jgi:hypothetical protein
MKYTVHMAMTTAEGQTETGEMACLEREKLTPTTLGLTLAEGKAILKALQEVVVERQVSTYLETPRLCAHCSYLQRSEGYHTTPVERSLAPFQYKACVSTIAPDNPMRPKCSIPWRCCCQNRPRLSYCSRRRSGRLGVVWHHRPALARCAADR